MNRAFQCGLEFGFRAKIHVHIKFLSSRGVHLGKMINTNMYAYIYIYRELYEDVCIYTCTHIL